ncbi:hypothetical protein C5167_022252 [Papaver somniferum]|uniref:Rubredoxin-like domain-containing protein n=1 Tax=Papaver somniferum TaxID=3469 RepID=A0A4Y7JLC3_PAPSO|nr:uncharacterized protein LOC113281327 [Papaver somniferum]RZC60475.1 hypothetical protein C5167_022252 [Papaver somniferum]
MALQAPVTSKLKNSSPAAANLSSPSTSHVGLRQTSDRFALKSAFFSSSIQLSALSPPKQQTTSSKTSLAPKIYMRAASKQSYICRDCGYIYQDRTPFEKQPDKYFCPVCAAPKRRFRVYEPPVNKNANATDTRKARKAELQRDEAVGKALPIAIAVGVAALAGLYFYLNSAF